MKVQHLLIQQTLKNIEHDRQLAPPLVYIRLQIMNGKLTGHIVQFYCELSFNCWFYTCALFAYAFRVTWSKRVSEVQPFVSVTSPKCIDREGLGRHRTGLGKNTL